MASSRDDQDEQTIPWSESKWDEESQLWYSDRIGPSGEIEYYWHPPNANVANVPRGFGGQETSPSAPYQSTSYPSYPSSPSSATGEITYPSTRENNYTTASSSASWSAPSPAYSSSYPAPISSSGTLSGNYDRSLGTPSASYHEPRPALAPAGSSSVALNPYYPSGNAQDGLRNLDSAFSGMNLNPIPEGVQPQKHIYKAPGSMSYETLDPRYRQVPEEDQEEFWKIGRVFMMLWTEPAGPPQVPAGGGTRNGSHISTTWLGQEAYSEIRRFVVIQEGWGNNICSPIQTYSGQATLKYNLPDRKQHAIIYTSRECPKEYSYKAKDGSTVREGLVKDPIRVQSEQDGPEGRLHPLSRLNYSKIYTVENYVRVLNIGMVHKDYISSLWRNSMIYRATPAEKPTKHPSRSGSSSHHHSSKGKGKGKTR
ncbi:hypothetical protein N431DRAFT_561801 [Stipitochalara longipes BDJ]|nr:hypothetical protein N431DRAFT_561801 [Stipitochalara longipes BDJ]